MTAPRSPGIGPGGCLGIDPGPVWTALALRARGGRYVGHRIIHRVEDETAIGPGPAYLLEIRAAVVDLLSVWHTRHRTAGEPVIAVEAVAAPRGYDIAARQKGGPRRAQLRPRDVMGLAYVAGAVVMAWPDAIIVPHGGYGTRPLATYPDELVTDGERRAKHPLGMLRPAGKSVDEQHGRAAWDLSGVALQIAQGLGSVQRSSLRARTP